MCKMATSNKLICIKNFLKNNQIFRIRDPSTLSKKNHAAAIYEETSGKIHYATVQYEEMFVLHLDLIAISTTIKNNVLSRQAVQSISYYITLHLYLNITKMRG